jgi:hypothetical protein
VNDATTDVPDVSSGRRSTSTWSRLRLRWRRLSARLRLGPLLVACVVALLVGVVVGRLTAPGADAGAAQVIESAILPLVLDADGIWNSASGDREPVAEALTALRRDDDPRPVQTWGEAWLVSYDGVLLQLAGLDMPASARPVQRQYITAVTLSRDAVEVLSHAAEVDDVDARRDLLTEVGRLRQRSEQLTASARASVLDLDGQRADVSPLPGLTSFLEGRRG